MAAKSTYNSNLFIELIDWIRDYIPSKSIFVADNASLHETQNPAKYFQKKFNITNFAFIFTLDESCWKTNIIN